MPDQPRPVWLTREQRDWLDALGKMPWDDPIKRIIAAWDAAPADATEAARDAATRSDFLSFEDIADAVLRALGCPDV